GCSSIAMNLDEPYEIGSTPLRHLPLDVLNEDLFSMSWHTSRLLLLIDCLADVFFLAGFPCAVTSPRSVWRLPLAWSSVSPTTFYPCGHKRPSPDSLCVF